MPRSRQTDTSPANRASPAASPAHVIRPLEARAAAVSWALAPVAMLANTEPTQAVLPVIGHHLNGLKLMKILAFLRLHLEYEKRLLYVV